MIIKKIRKYNHWSRVIIAVMSSTAVVSVLSSLAEIPTLTIIAQAITFVMAIFTIVITYYNFPESLAAYSGIALDYLELEKDYINLWQTWGDYEGDDIQKLKEAYKPIQEKHYQVKVDGYEKNYYEFTLSDEEKEQCQNDVDYKFKALGFM